MKEIINPLENAWVVAYPSTTVPKGESFNTNNTEKDYVNYKNYINLIIYEGMHIETECNWYCDCGKYVEPEWKYCPYCGKKLWSRK